MVKVTKLGFISMNAVDFDGMRAYYRDVVGLPEQYADDRSAYYSCGPDHHAVSLHKAATAGLRHIGLEVRVQDSLADMVRHLRAQGVAADLRSDDIPGVPHSIRITDPEGAVIHLYADTTGSDRAYGTGGGILPGKLGHVAYFVENAKRAEAFYTEALGFRWSDWIEDIFLFMRCNADHHTINFLRSDHKGLFHAAYELHDFSHIGRACDILASHGMPVIWGPGRHGAGHNIFIYHRDPDGNVIEYFTELDRMLDEDLGCFDPRPYHEDYPQRPKVWAQSPLAGNKWGVSPPPGFGAINLARKG